MKFEWDADADHFEVGEGRDCNCGAVLVDGFDRHLQRAREVGYNG